MTAIPSTHISLLHELEGSPTHSRAWEVFYARYREVILCWCRSRGVPRSCAEDLTQEVFLVLSQRLPHYHHDPQRGRFRSWLQVVVHNVVTDFWRKQRLRPDWISVGGSSLLDRLASIATVDDPGESSISKDNKAAEILARVRARLKETTWQAFYQSMVEKQPAAEVAARLNMSVATVYKSNYRVKQMLLEEYRHAHEHNSSAISELSGPEDPGKPPP